jgi:hypothetical protein
VVGTLPIRKNFLIEPTLTYEKGNLGGALIPGTLKYEWRRTLGMGHLSMRELREGNLEGKLLYWGP